MVSTTSGANVKFYEGDKLADGEKMTADGEDKSQKGGFYDEKTNTIYLNADKTGDTKSLLSTVRHENQHAIDKANGVDYETYSKDKDGYEDLAKKSSTEFFKLLSTRV